MVTGIHARFIVFQDYQYFAAGLTSNTCFLFVTPRASEAAASEAAAKAAMREQAEQASPENLRDTLLV